MEERFEYVLNVKSCAGRMSTEHMSTAKKIPGELHKQTFLTALFSFSFGLCLFIMLTMPYRRTSNLEMGYFQLWQCIFHPVQSSQINIFSLFSLVCFTLCIYLHSRVGLSRASLAIGEQAGVEALEGPLQEGSGQGLVHRLLAGEAGLLLVHGAEGEVVGEGVAVL